MMVGLGAAVAYDDCVAGYAGWVLCQWNVRLYFGDLRYMQVFQGPFDDRGRSPTKVETTYFFQVPYSFWNVFEVLSVDYRGGIGEVWFSDGSLNVLDHLRFY